MIANPPNIILLLQAYKALTRHGVSGGPLSTMLAVLLNRHLGQLTWEQFQAAYHLYLQSIPFDLARTAWGLNAAKSEPNPTKQP